MEFMDLIEIPRIDGIKYCRHIYNNHDQAGAQFVECTLCLTSHHLIFKSKKDELWIMHSNIDLLEMKLRENNTRFQLIIKCKDFQIITVEFNQLNHLQSIFKSLDALSNITSESMKLPFFHLMKTNSNDGWTWFSIDKEYEFFFSSSSNNDDSNGWRITDINANFSVCSTYPQKLIVPRKIDDLTLVKSSQFRSMGRLPILSYFHETTKSFMMKCSQPLLGNNNKRSKEDELYLKSVLPNNKKGYIYDLRDVNIMKLAARSNQGGYETDHSYPLWKLVNRHLDKFDQLQLSYGKLVDACSNLDPDQKWLTKLDTSGWYASSRQAMHVACCIADELHNKNGCVIVHGADGTDNTLLITSLVKLLLNPEYRTLKGFQQLIEIEWLLGGHPFSKRYFKSAYGSTNSKQEGPVFVLFLDCVRQLLDQFCLSFEFNQDYLILLFDNVYASQYGTFLGTCQRDREDLFAKTRTISLWSALDIVNDDKYLNPVYERNNNVIWPSLHYNSLTIWCKLFLRYQRNELPFVEEKNEIKKLCQANSQARLKVDKLRK